MDNVVYIYHNLSILQFFSSLLANDHLNTPKLLKKNYEDYKTFLK